MQELTAGARNPEVALLELRQIRHRFGGNEVLKGLDLRIYERDLRCLIGPNGCGKTTLFNLISGAFPPTSGQVLLEGWPLIGMRPDEIVARGLVRKFQVPGIYPELTVVENIELGLMARAGRRVLGLLRARLDADRLAQLLEICGLRDCGAAPAGTLAHGQKQWLEIAMLLATDARVILLDEPTAGMTEIETEQTAALIRRLADEFGKTVFAIEHDMTFVRLLDCPVVAMLDGHIAREGSYEDIRNDSAVMAGYLGVAAD